jgi:hypothetical protein
MNKHSKAIKVAILAVVAAAVLVAAAACANPVALALNSSSWGLVGTWGNPGYGAYAVSPTQCAVLELRADGTFKATSTGSIAGTYTIGTVTVTGNTRVYQIRFDIPTPTTLYVLARITDGTTYESVSSMTFTYPTSISAADGSYGKLAPL